LIYHLRGTIIEPLLSGNRLEPTPTIWQETYVSALLRAIRYADDPSYRLAGYRKLDPITTPEAEQKFLEAAEAVFFKGKTHLSHPSHSIY
jgi:hypothetical protein